MPNNKYSAKGNMPPIWRTFILAGDKIVSFLCEYYFFNSDKKN